MVSAAIRQEKFILLLFYYFTPYLSETERERIESGREGITILFKSQNVCYSRLAYVKSNFNNYSS